MPINIIATAHGTDSTDGRETINSIIKCLQERLSHRLGPVMNVYEAYVDVQIPALEEVVQMLPRSEESVILPLLLSTGYHMEVDMKEAADFSGIEKISIASSLGPSHRLAKLMHTRLIEQGWRTGDPVVMAGAGSSRAEGREAVAQQSQLLAEEIGQEVTFGFVADIEPRITEVIQEAQQGEKLFVANYLLGRGYFNAQLKRVGAAQGALVADPLMIPGDEQACDLICQCAIDSLDGVE